MLLTDKQIQQIAKTGKPGRYKDRPGLFLTKLKSGTLTWQSRVHLGKETIVSHGLYPAITLAKARECHAQTQSQISVGMSPTLVKRVERFRRIAALGNTLEDVAGGWHKRMAADEWTDSYAEKVLGRLKRHIYPHLGSMPVHSITTPDVLIAVERVAAAGNRETAFRVLRIISQVFRYAAVKGLVPTNYDPSVGIADHLPQPVTRHMPALLTPDALAEYLRAADGYMGAGPYVRAALTLLPMLLTRPGELRHAKWEELDLEKGMWTIPASKMKGSRERKQAGEPHLVPLSTQAVAVLKGLMSQSAPTGYVFKGQRDHDRPMSDGTINAALRRLGYDTTKEVTGHGFRATARTVGVEVLGFNKDVVEMQLAHSVSDSLGTAYNRTTFHTQRVELMQEWSDYLDELRAKRVLSVLE